MFTTKLYKHPMEPTVNNWYS